jgi:hypothetical protein
MSTEAPLAVYDEIDPNSLSAVVYTDVFWRYLLRISALHSISVLFKTSVP